MLWRVIVSSGKLSAAENMAIDEAILLGNIAGTSPATIRFYEWELPTASVGYNQVAEKEVDFALLENLNYDFVRRPTGGRLVLHKDEITYSVISKTEERLEGNITKSYSEISKALATGLQKIGVNVAFEKGELSSAHQREENNPCFTSASKYELKYNRKKIVGSAQVRKENCLLQHGSILLDNGQGIVADILPNLDQEKRNKLKKYLNKKTICINEIIENPIDFNEGVEKLIEGIRKNWHEDKFFLTKEINDIEKEIVEDLVKNKYSTIEWNRKKRTVTSANVTKIN